jgi:MEDS: MEthanogen/methylotroph, DcmR Sensory domain
MSTARLPDPQSESAPQPNWLELDRSPHALQFYSGDSFLLDSLARFISTALEDGNSVFVLATPMHMDGIGERLNAQGVDTNTAARKGRYVTVDALQVLAHLTVNGELSRARFDEFIREVFMPLEAAAESKPKLVAVCGEVVSLLWAEGKAEAAIELEHFWNELAERVCCRLRCFYPIASFPDPVQNELFLKLCAEHADVIPHHGHLHMVAGRDKVA